jgi:hypothetical protein
VSEPTFISDTPGFVDLEAANAGAKFQGFDLTEHGINVARVMEAKDANGIPLYRNVVVLMPRRSQKTTSIWTVIIGRCLTIPGYRVVTTAQSQKSARKRFMDVRAALMAANFEEQGLGQIKRGKGDEEIIFTNGSKIWTVAPNSGSFRGEAADCILFDEAGEYEEEQSRDLISGALPIMNTRKLGQVIITGTPGKRRSGMLWDTLQKARAGGYKRGIVDYSARDNESTMLEEGTPNWELLQRVHPGIHPDLTPLELIQDDLDNYSWPEFEREYFCRFPFDNSVTAIDRDHWAAGEVEEFPQLPERFTLSMDVANDGSCASLVAAWRDEDGRAYVGLVGHQSGTTWLPKTAYDALSKHPKATLVYDPIGENLEPAKTLERERKVNSRVKPAARKDLQAGQTNLVNTVHQDMLSHPGQPAMNEAIEVLRWRDTPNAGRWLSAGRSGGDISPIRAAAMALWAYDQKPTVSKPVIYTRA